MNWNDLLSQQFALREQHARQCALAGYGQPLDEALWPVIERFWALGIPTTGSCQGHPQGNGEWSQSFVLIRHRPGIAARWNTLVLGLLDVVGMPGVQHKVFARGWECCYTDRGEHTPEVRWRHGLNDWLEVLDTVGNRTIQQQGLTWEPWSGPALAVPQDIVVTPGFTDRLLAFRRQLSPDDHLILTLGLELSNLEEVAHRLNRPLDRINSAWQHVWEAWRNFVGD